MNDSGPARFYLLPVLFVCIFGVSAILLTRVAPGPLKELDYMVIGTVSVMIGLLFVFLVFSKRREAAPKPMRRRESTSILGLGEESDQVPASEE